MNVAGGLGFEVSEECLAVSAGSKRQPDLDVSPLHPARFVFGKALHHAGKQRVRRLKAGAQEMLQAILNFTGK